MALNTYELKHALLKALAALKDYPDEQPVTLAVNGEEIPSQLLSFDLGVATLNHNDEPETTLDVNWTTVL